MTDQKITLAAARINAKMTQEEVAKSFGVSRDTIGKWERGLVSLKPVQLMALSELYEWPIDLFDLPKIN